MMWCWIRSKQSFDECSLSYSTQVLPTQMVTMVTMGGDLQPGCLADRLPSQKKSLVFMGSPCVNLATLQGSKLLQQVLQSIMVIRNLRAAAAAIYQGHQKSEGCCSNQSIRVIRNSGCCSNQSIRVIRNLGVNGFLV